MSRRAEDAGLFDNQGVMGIVLADLENQEVVDGLNGLCGVTLVHWTVAWSDCRTTGGRLAHR